MVSIPPEFRNPLIELLEWHLNEFPENQDTVDFSFKRLKRLYEDLCGRRYELDHDSLYYLKEAIYDARENIDKFAVTLGQFTEIANWVDEQRKNRKP